MGAAVDVGVVAVLASLLYLGVAGLRFVLWPASFWWPPTPTLMTVAAVALISVVYLTTGWETTGRSLGGNVLGFRVVSHRRDLLGWPRAGTRAALCVLFPLGLAVAAVGPGRRALQDVLLRSTVVYD